MFFVFIFILNLVCFQSLSNDSVTVFVNAIMYYRVKDPISAVANVDDYNAEKCFGNKKSGRYSG
jgi:hypothetical protein